MRRVLEHPILGSMDEREAVTIYLNGQPVPAVAGETILAALTAHGVQECRTTHKRHQARWFYCGIGRCTDCIMQVNGVPNVRTCVTPVEDGMRIETQEGLGRFTEVGE